jgi:hypothetical protein
MSGRRKGHKGHNVYVGDDGVFAVVVIDSPTHGLTLFTDDDEKKMYLAIDDAFEKVNAVKQSSRKTVLDVWPQLKIKNQGSKSNADHVSDYSSSSLFTDSDGEHSTNPIKRRQSMLSQSVINFKKQHSSKKLTLFALSLVSLALYLTMSIIAPFFPYEANRKGMSSTGVGLVFSVYALVMMIASPLLGKALPYLGVKFMLLAGIWFAGWANILFGVLDMVEDTTTFTILCFLTRSIGALGAASFSTASYRLLQVLTEQTRFVIS